jgi:hypothetical protein
LLTILTRPTIPTRYDAISGSKPQSTKKATWCVKTDPGFNYSERHK